MTESEKFIGDYCKSCKNCFYHGDRIVLARNLKFFHFNCYAKKNFFYRLINSIYTYFIWQEQHISIDDINDSLKKYVSLFIDKKDKAPEMIAAGGDAKTDIHELKVSKPIGIPKKKDEQNQTCETTLDVTVDEEIVSEKTDSVAEIKIEIQELMSKIDMFENQKDHDSQIIKQMDSTIQRHLQQINELNRQNYFLRQETLLLQQKLNNASNNAKEWQSA